MKNLVIVSGRRRRRNGSHALPASTGPGSQTGPADRESPVLSPAQRALAAQHMGLVGVHLRNRVPTPRRPMRQREYDDLFQEGCVALVRSASRYDPGRDGPFAAFVLPRIRAAIHAALHRRFSLIRVPARALARARASGDLAAQRERKPVELPADDGVIEPSGTAIESASGQTIRHAVRHRFERAVRHALADLGERRWRRRNPCPIMSRVAAERLLISRESARTPLRQIARESGVSSSRAAAYEQQLTEVVSQYFACDAQLPLLVRFAGEDPAGFDGPVDPRRRELLLQAELEAFEDRFVRLERSARAELVYSMIEHSASAVLEVACNLYRLTATEESAAPSWPAWKFYQLGASAAGVKGPRVPEGAVDCVTSGPLT